MATDFTTCASDACRSSYWNREQRWSSRHGRPQQHCRSL